MFTPKYRRKVIYNQLRSDIRDIIKRLCKYKGVEILEGHLMPDHVHLLLSIPPKYSVSQIMGYIKGKSSLEIFDKHANLKYKYGNRIAKDKLSVKEYEDPFGEDKENRKPNPNRKTTAKP